jgi:transposase-like protein
VNSNNEQTVEPPKRWSAKRKAEVVLRLFRGEAIDAVSRDVAIPIHSLQEWKEEAIANMEEGFKQRTVDPKNALLSRAKERIGELSMENELLKERIKKKGPYRSKRLNP